jgi:hypothetical protein
LSKLLKAMCVFCIPAASTGRLPRAVPKIPAESSVPPELPINKSRSLLTRAESALPQPLIPLHFNSRISNTYKKPGEGTPQSSPKDWQLVTTCLPVLRTRRNSRNPNPLYALLHNFRTPRGWGQASQRDSHPWLSTAAFWVTEHGPRPHWSPGTVAPQPAKCQNHGCYSLVATGKHFRSPRCLRDCERTSGRRC